jgi:hypothetical protein
MVKELVEIDGASERDVPEMPLALQVGVLARGADLAALNDTETLVKHAARDGIVALMRLIRHDFNNRPPKDFFGGHDAKLNAYD